MVVMLRHGPRRRHWCLPRFRPHDIPTPPVGRLRRGQLTAGRVEQIGRAAKSCDRLTGCCFGSEHGRCMPALQEAHRAGLRQLWRTDSVPLSTSIVPVAGRLAGTVRTG